MPRKKGYKMAQETKDKISNSLLGTKRSIKTRQNISAGKLGKKRSQEFKDSMSEKMKLVHANRKTK